MKAKLGISCLLMFLVSLCSNIQAEDKAKDIRNYQVYNVSHLDDLNKGDSIILKFGIHQTSNGGTINDPDFIYFGNMKITLIKKGMDTAKTLTRKQKLEITRLAYGFVKNAHDKHMRWPLGCGALVSQAYKFAYRKVVIKENLSKFVYLDHFPRELPSMEFGEIKKVKKRCPPIGSMVYELATNGGAHVVFGAGKGYVFSASHGTRVGYLKTPSRCYVYLMPTFCYRFYFDPFIDHPGGKPRFSIFMDKKTGKWDKKKEVAPVYRPLPWKKDNLPKWAQSITNESFITWQIKSRSHFFLLPGTIIKCEFFPNKNYTWDGWYGFTTLKACQASPPNPHCPPDYHLKARNISSQQEENKKDVAQVETAIKREKTKGPIFIRIERFRSIRATVNNLAKSSARVNHERKYWPGTGVAAPITKKPKTEKAIDPKPKVRNTSISPQNKVKTALALGRNYETNGMLALAQKKYRETINRYPDAPGIEKVKEHLQILEDRLKK